MVPVRIENRAQLIYLLTEAAELEHEILCCYLFATFSMKDDTSEGLTEPQLLKVREWRGVINEIVVQEMIHLSTACNLLTAIGGAPQLRRPNLPTSPRAYPPGFQLRLVPFTLEAVEQFVTLEKPEAVYYGEGPVDYRSSALPLDRLGDIFSSERNFATVGELYRGIEDGFDYLAQKLGETSLFVGPTSAQTADQFFSLPGLIAVRDLATAKQAIQVIVEQGEGASIDVPDSHYNRFLRIYEEYRDMVAADPDFVPGRAVLTSPYATLPPDVADHDSISLIDDPLAADISNLFDGCYELMVQVLGRLFMHGDEAESELMSMADVAVGLMIEVVSPLGSALTLLPAGPSHPGLRAGASFRLSRGAHVPSHRESARVLFHERIAELQRYCRFLTTQSGAPAALAPVGEALSRFASAFA